MSQSLQKKVSTKIISVDGQHPVFTNWDVKLKHVLGNISKQSHLLNAKSCPINRKTAENSLGTCFFWTSFCLWQIPLLKIMFRCLEQRVF